MTNRQQTDRQKEKQTDRLSDCLTYREQQFAKLCVPAYILFELILQKCEDVCSFLDLRKESLNMSSSKYRLNAHEATHINMLIMAIAMNFVL